MSVFFNVLPPAEALALLLQHIRPLAQTEQIATTDALARVTASTLHSPHALPTFRRGTMDGFAVRAVDTHGASGSLPALLRIAGEVFMGQRASIEIGPGDAAIIHTGGELPATADAVVAVEETEPVSEQEIEVVKAVAVGENVIQVGEDVAVGEEILAAGHWIRPQDIGGLLALGVVKVPVTRRPRVALISSGDELVPPDWPEVGPAQVRDINSYTAAALTRQAGGMPLVYGIVPDRLEALRAAAKQAMDEADVLVFSAGSSVSVRDATAEVISGLGKPGILFHGVAVRPGKPTIGAIVDSKPAFGLPGNPVSAMNLFRLLVVPVLYRMLGCQNPPRRCAIQARVARNVAAAAGREDHVAARLVQRHDGLWAEPVFGKSNLIYTLVRADGTFVIPLDSGGVTAGDWVEVQLFQS